MHRARGEVAPGAARVIERSAAFSPDGAYRYSLGRTWGTGARLAFVMLNPSRADATVDDPTIRRCMGFARREAFEGIVVVNLYAMRSTEPVGLRRRPDPEGPDNRAHWDRVLGDQRVAGVVAGWGGSCPTGLPPSRALAGYDTSGWLCLGSTRSGAPRHPLYVPAHAPLVPWCSDRRIAGASLNRR